MDGLGKVPWKELKERIKRNNNFGMKMFLFIIVVGYVFFFTSLAWVPEKQEMIDITPYYQKVKLADYTFYISKSEYSQQDAAIQIIMEMESTDVTGKELTFSAVERTLGQLDVKAVCQEPNYAVLRITDLNPKWKEISVRVQVAGDQTQAKFYTNIDVIEKKTSLPNLTETEYKMERLQAQIEYDTAQIQQKEKEIVELQEENKKISERIKALQEDTYPTEEEASKARELVIQAENQMKSNEDVILDRQKEAEKLEIRSANIQEEMKTLKEK